MSELSALAFKGKHNYPTEILLPRIGGDSGRIRQSLSELFSSRNISDSSHLSHEDSAVSLRDKLYDSRAAFKIRAAAIAMYLDKQSRDRLFAQIDSLLDAEQWEEGDMPIVESSCATFLRMILLIDARRRPGLGATSDGNLVASWTVGKDRLTIECLPEDQVRWVLVRYSEDERESAAGQMSLQKLPERLRPYDPNRWFLDEGEAKTFA